VILVTTVITDMNVPVLLHVHGDISVMMSPKNVSNVKNLVPVVLMPIPVTVVQLDLSYGKDNVMKVDVPLKCMPFYQPDYMDLSKITPVKNVTILV
jgi:hypothetical protein